MGVVSGVMVFAVGVGDLVVWHGMFATWWGGFPRAS